MSVAEHAKQVYESDFKTRCEAEHLNRFIAIEPISRSHFMADEFVEAALAAKHAFPDRETFVIRIGYATAFHFGLAISGPISHRLQPVVKDQREFGF